MKYKNFLSWIINLLIFFVGSLIILVVAYRYGWMLLRGPLNWGNDIPFGLSYVSYIDRWWPNIPRWHYEWAGGMPLLRNYPFLMAFITSWAEHLTSFTMVQITRFIFWFSMPLAGIGIMILAKLYTKNWLIGILAGVFSLLSPDPWLWIIQGGFFAVSNSYPFMVFTLVLFELSWLRKQRILWVLTILLYGLTWTAHPTAGVATSIVFLISALVKGIRAKEIVLSISKVFIVCISGFFLMSFWTLSFLFSRPGEIGFTANQIPYIPLNELLGLIGPRDLVYITSGFFSGSVYFLALLGLIFVFFRKSRQMLVVIICTLIGMILITGPGYVPWLLIGPILVFWGMIGARATIIVRIFLPILAAYAAISFGETAFIFMERILKNLKNNFLWQVPKQILGGVIAIIFAILIFQKVVIVPKNMPVGYFYQGYGPVYSGFNIEKINGEWRTNGGKDIFFPNAVESLKGLLKLRVDDSPITLGLPSLNLPKIIKEEGLTENDRVDIFEGSTTAVWNDVSGVAQTNPYVGVSLINPMFGYEQACLHNLLKTCNASEVQSLAKWWGLKIVYVGGMDSLVTKSENLTAIKKAGFKEKIIDNTLVYEIPNYAGLATISNKPLILVIGDNPPFHNAFRSTFYSFNRSQWNYEKEILVEGKRYIDDYSLEDLKKFKTVVLYGYKTHNKDNAWVLLSKYVEEGGNIFVDTGWQYWSEDWGKVDSSGIGEEIDMPNLLPVSKTKWQTVGSKWQDLGINNKKLSSKVSTNGWADLTWEGKDWGLSLADLNSLKEDSFSLVTDKGKIVIAGRNYGKGKVVWSGMNFFGHTAYYPSEPENDFLSAVFSWFIPQNKFAEENLSFKRETPDRIVINIDKKIPGGKNVMFKEVDAPGWKAVEQVGNNEKELPILRAGPGWKLLQLSENSGGQIILNYGRTLREWIYISLTILTFLGLLVFLTDGLLKGKILKLLKVPNFNRHVTGKIKNVKENWKSDEEEY